ncbi:hypothetical protein BD770DRAFT_382441 [Pilaira anomala]|nr:hypothetical protein BD770DRAFT_382441 [Pilaira anomala]
MQTIIIYTLSLYIFILFIFLFVLVFVKKKMINLKRTGTLLLLSIFSLQILAQTESLTSSEKPRTITLTFVNPDKQVAVTLSDKSDAIPTSIDDLKGSNEQSKTEEMVPPKQEETQTPSSDGLQPDNQQKASDNLQQEGQQKGSDSLQQDGQQKGVDGTPQNNQQKESDGLPQDNQHQNHDALQPNGHGDAQDLSQPTDQQQGETYIDPNSINEHALENAFDNMSMDEQQFEDTMPYPDYMGYENEPIMEEAQVSSEPSPIEVKSTTTEPSSTPKIQAAAVVAEVEKPPTAPRPALAQITGCKTQGQIALTYNEGPSDVTAKIVRQLTKADARANFFVNATWLYTQQYAMVVQNIYNAGHFIGMTYRVANDDPSSMTDDQIREDIINNAQTIERLINVAPKYVRLHYTEVKDTRTEGILQELGFVLVGYNLDSLDYFKKDATGPDSIQQVYSDTFVKYKDTYDAKGSFISIQYDLPYTGSLAAIPHVINTIDKEGYTMVRLDGCLNDATPYKKSANSSEYVGDKFSFTQSKYHEGQKSIVLETAEEAAEADEIFKMQGIVSNIATMQQVSFSALFLVVGSIFTLLL